MRSISCNIQHVTHQQSQLEIERLMLWKRTCRHFWQAKMAIWKSHPHDEIIKRMKVRAAWRQKGSKPWENCAACNQKRSFFPRKDKIRTFWAMKTNRNGSRIIWIERPLWQDSKFKTLRQRLWKSTKIREMMKRIDQHPEVPEEKVWTWQQLSKRV